MFIPSPFASKELANGKKLFRRMHGYQVTLSGTETSYEITVPYAACKINKAEILWAPAGVTVDFQVLDTDQGHIQQAAGIPENQAVPNLLLNQFGFSINVAKDQFEDSSPYDADLIQGMKIKVIFKHPLGAAGTVLGVNIPFHEVVG